MEKLKLIIGVTGASGSIYGKLLLQKLKTLENQIEECCVIFSENSRSVWEFENGSFNDVDIPFKTYQPEDLFAPPASGSSGYNVMIICPCSMGTLGRIAGGISCDLLTRAADVILKERKRLVLVTREMPYSLIHITNMKLLTEAGAIICPASPSFYSKPTSLEEAVMTVLDKVLVQAGFEFPAYRWGK